MPTATVQLADGRSADVQYDTPEQLDSVIQELSGTKGTQGGAVGPGGASPFSQALKGAPRVQGMSTRGTGNAGPQPTGQTDFNVPNGDMNVTLATKLALVDDPNTKVRLAAEALFPGQKGAEQRFGYVNGQLAYADDNGQLKYVTGKGSRIIGNVIANIPEMIGGAAGSATGTPVAGGALGAAAGRAFKKIGANLVLGEPQTPGGNAADIAKTGAEQFVVGGLAKGALSVANRGRAIDFNPSNMAAARQTQKETQAATGVNPDLALASGDRRLLALRNYLAQQPNDTAAAIQTADEANAGQISKAAQALLDKIATQKPTDTLGKEGIDAAQSAIAAARKAASDKVRPQYDQAYASQPAITDPQITRFLGLPYFKQAMGAGRRIARLEGRAQPVVTTEARTPIYDSLGMQTGENVTKTSEKVYSLQDYDYLKRGLDDVIDGLLSHGKRTEARALLARKNEFIAALDSASGDLYKQARAAYAAEAKNTLDPLENGIIGVIAKVKDTRAATVATKLFRDQNVTPGEVALARRAIEAQNPDAWNGLARQWLAQEWNAAQKATQAGAPVNAAGKFAQSIAGTPDLVTKVRAALGPDAAEAYDGLVKTAQILARAPIRGSNTQPNQAISQVLEGGRGWWLRTLLTPRQSALGAAQKSAVDDNSAKLWEALSDPAKVKQLKIALTVRDSTKRATYITSALAGQTADAVAGALTETRPPEQ